MVELQFVGGGRMAEAILAGLLSAGERDPAGMRVVETSAARRDELATRYPGLAVGEDVDACEGLVMATKPDVVLEALEGAAAAGARRVLSVAAGIPLSALERAVDRAAPSGSSTSVVRAMPNTPCLVGEGMSAICIGDRGDDSDLSWAGELLGAVGAVEVVAESQMDAVTGLSGSGPAYLFLVAESLIEAGVANGLPREVSERLATQTLLGASTLLARDGRSAEDLRVMVTSPGGTTEVALAVLREQGLPEALGAAVAAAADRSAEMAPPA